MTAAARKPIAPAVRRVALLAWVLLVFAFLLAPVVVIVLASFSSTSYLTVPPRGSRSAGSGRC